jgi:hypothetical protein
VNAPNPPLSPERPGVARGEPDRAAAVDAELKALLLLIDDKPLREATLQAYYDLSQGDPRSTPVQLAIFFKGLVYSCTRQAAGLTREPDPKLAKGMAELKALAEQALRETSELRKEVSRLAEGAQSNVNLPGVVAQQTTAVLEPRIKACMNDLVTRCRVLPVKYFWWLLGVAAVLVFVLGIVVHMWWAQPSAPATARVAAQVREVQPDSPRPLPRVNQIDPAELDRSLQEADRQIQATQRLYPQVRGAPSPTPKH